MLQTIAAWIIWAPEILVYFWPHTLAAAGFIVGGVWLCVRTY